MQNEPEFPIELAESMFDFFVSERGIELARKFVAFLENYPTDPIMSRLAEDGRRAFEQLLKIKAEYENDLKNLSTSASNEMPNGGKDAAPNAPQTQVDTSRDYAFSTAIQETKPV